MADSTISALIQRTPNGQEYFEVIIPPFTAGTNRKVLLSDLSAILGGNVPDADPTTKGILKLYTDLAAQNTDGAPDQNAVFDALALKAALINAAVVLTDGATIDLTAIKHTLSTSSSRTFTISYTGDDITIELTLSATSATQTFPAAALCVSDGLATGDNTLPLAGVSGDKYVIAIKKIGSAYYVVSKNFGQ